MKVELIVGERVICSRMEKRESAGLMRLMFTSRMANADVAASRFQVYARQVVKAGFCPSFCGYVDVYVALWHCDLASSMTAGILEIFTNSHLPFSS